MTSPEPDRPAWGQPQPPNQTPGQPLGPGWVPPGANTPPEWRTPAEPPKKGGAGKKVGLGCLGVLGVIILIGAIGAAMDKKPSGTTTAAVSATPAATKAPAPAIPASQAPAAPATSAAAAPPATSAPAVTQHTVTFIVTGAANADVQYGSAGSTNQGNSPMKISEPLGNPLYYSISAQLQGDGKVSCELQVDGKAISQASASGGYNIATCEISKNPFNGQWKDTNQG